METRTFYSNNFIDETTIELVGDEFFHATKVDRIKQHDVVRVINNTENEYICNVKQINKNSMLLNVFSVELCKSNPKCEIDVFACLLKGDKNDNLIPKLSELGVSNVTFIISQNVDRKNNLNFDRLNKLAIQSAKQCGRSKVLNINAKILTLAELANLKNSYKNLLVFYENEKENSINSIKLQSGKTAIVIGSEGGFLQSEIDNLVKNNFTSVSLGNIILKAETACVVATTLTTFKLGGFNV